MCSPPRSGACWRCASPAARDAHVKTILNSGIKALEKLRSEKVIKAYGAGVNEWEVCEILARNADVDIFLLAGRYTLLEQEALTSFLPLCEERGIGIVLGGPYNSGILSGDVRPGVTHDYVAAPPALVEKAQRIEAVCRRHAVELGAAALQFPLFHPAVCSVIPGALAVREVTQNAARLSAPIPADLWSELKREGLLDPAAPTPN